MPLPLPKKTLALAVGLAASLGAATVAQQQPRRASQGAETVVVAGHVDWLEKSAVSARAEGVIAQIELRPGQEVKKDRLIGALDSKKAEIAVEKATLLAEAQGPLAKAEAQKEVALSSVARIRRGLQLMTNLYSREDVSKAEAEFKLAAAMVQDAEENRRVAGVEKKLAERVLEEHNIRAPFDGIITQQLKYTGEAVRANEAVVEVGRLDTLKFIGELPIESAYRVQPGMKVDVRVTIEGADLPIERKLFRGKLAYVNPELVDVTRQQAQALVVAEVDNREEVVGPLRLNPGLKAEMIIYMNEADAPPPQAAPAVGARTTAANPTR